MKKIIRKRGGGKTTELIKMSAKTWAYIVCQTMARADFIAKYAQKLNLKIPFPITYSDIFENRMRCVFPCVKFLLDDAEDFIRIIFDRNTRFDALQAITLTDEEPEKQKCGHCKEGNLPENPILGCDDCNVGFCDKPCLREHFRINHIPVVEFYQGRNLTENANAIRYFEYYLRPRCVKCKQDVVETEEHVCQS